MPWTKIVEHGTCSIQKDEKRFIISTKLFFQFFTYAVYIRRDPNHHFSYNTRWQQIWHHINTYKCDISTIQHLGNQWKKRQGLQDKQWHALQKLLYETSNDISIFPKTYGGKGFAMKFFSQSFGKLYFMLNLLKNIGSQVWRS